MMTLTSEYAGKADKTCATDSDCTLVELTSDCFYDCPAAVSKSGAPALEGALKGIEQSFCPPYLVDGCTLVTNMVGCFRNLKCVSNLCQATFSP
jgi:hypothetical protein